jgi:integrase
MVSAREPLEDDELRRMLDTVEDHPLRDRLIIHALAYIGLRASALAHLTEDWINYQEQRVEVPAFQSCRAGRDGGPCSECVKRLELIRADPDAVDTYASRSDRWAGQPNSLKDRAKRFQRYADRPGLDKRTLETLLEDHRGMWFPKSGEGHRPIPVKDGDTWNLIQRWFTAYDDLMVTRQTIGNVVTRVARDSGIRRKVLPHEFRHTYGTRLAALDFTAYEIKDAMGHASTAQAEDYIKIAGKRLDDAFTDKWESV